MISLKIFQKFITSLTILFYFQALILISTLINFFVGTICFFFAREYLMRFIPIYIICDLLYLFNVVVISLHQFWKDLNKKIYVVRIPISLYILDIISLLPQELIAVAIFGSNSIVSVSLRWITYIRLRYLINFIQVSFIIYSCIYAWYFSKTYFELLVAWNHFIFNRNHNYYKLEQIPNGIEICHMHI